MTGRLAASLAALSGWRRRGALFSLGAVAALALPPVGLIPVLLLAIPALVLVWDASATRPAAFGAGWWWGLGFYTAGFYWIANALLIEPEKFGWLVPFATLGLGGVVAVFSGLATLLAALPGWRGPGRVALLAVAWTLTEWLRTFVLTGFPWNPLGSVWDPLLPVLQFGALAGVHGLTMMTMLVFALPVVAIECGRRRRWAVLALAAALPVAAFAGGSVRLALEPTKLLPGVQLRLVQPRVAQTNKWRSDQAERNFALDIALSRRPGFENVSAVIWPETAAPFFLDIDGGHRAQALAAVPPGGLLLAGAARITPQGVEPLQIWNSLLAIDGEGGIDGIYDKVHLVPFGEYVPFRGLLPLAKITHGGIDFSAGPGPRTLVLPGLPPVSPIICYEAIFPAAMVGADQPRPGWLLNITNDGWFGISAGPHQHLAAARMRAIEEGLPLARAANTGISAVFDGLGREIARLDLGEQGIVDAGLPEATAITPYGRWGNLAPLCFGAFALAFGWVFRRKQ